VGARVRSLLLLVLAGCGYDEARFEEDYPVAYCEWASDCGYFESSEACLEADADEVARDGCTYDSHEARTCVDGVDALACPDGGAFPEVPAACSAVYACP
jgi:hypothetical protein